MGANVLPFGRCLIWRCLALKVQHIKAWRRQGQEKLAACNNAVQQKQCVALGNQKVLGTWQGGKPVQHSSSVPDRAVKGREVWLYTSVQDQRCSRPLVNCKAKPCNLVAVTTSARSSEHRLPTHRHPKQHQHHHITIIYIIILLLNYYYIYHHITIKYIIILINHHYRMHVELL